MVHFIVCNVYILDVEIYIKYIQCTSLFLIWCVNDFLFWRAIYTEMACIIFKKQVDRKEKRKLVSFSKKLAVREEMSN